MSSSAVGCEEIRTRCANGGRLLERLQQRVLALLGHRVRLLDHEHPPLALERPVGRRLDHALADLVDQVLRSGRAKPGQVRVRRGVGERPAPGRVGVRRAGGEQLGDERPRRRRACPEPGGAGEEVGVRRGSRARPPAPSARPAGPRWRRRGVSGSSVIGRARPPAPARAPPRASPSPSTTTMRSGVALGELVVGRRDGALQLDALGLEPVRAVLGALGEALLAALLGGVRRRSGAARSRPACRGRRRTRSAARPSRGRGRGRRPGRRRSSR